MPARIGGMATFPARFHTLPDVVSAIAPQLDTLYLYINQSDVLPEGLSQFENVVPLLGKDHDGDLSATGKVYPLKLAPDDCYYFTLDDDFIYPPDYVERMTAAIDLFDRRAAVTVHGSIFAPEADWYYERCRAFAAVRPLDRYHFATLPGSGTAAFHRGGLRVSYEDFPRQPMVDLQLAINALEQGVPWIAVPRGEKWLTFLGHEGLWQTSVEKMTHHTVAMLNHGPWSFDRFRPIYRDFIDGLDAPAVELLEEAVVSCLQNDRKRPCHWGETKLAATTRERHDRLMDRLLDRKRPAPQPEKVPAKPSVPYRGRKEIVRMRLQNAGVPRAIAGTIAESGSRLYTILRRFGGRGPKARSRPYGARG